MRQLRRFICAAGACLAVGSASFAAEPLIGTRDLHALGYFKYWDAALELDRGGVVRAVHLLDDSLYVVTDKGEVHAVHAGVGLPRWSQNLVESVYQVFAPAHVVDEHDKALAVFSTTPRTVIIDRHMGDLVADMPLDKAVSSPTVADAENIYFGSNDGHVYAMIWNDPRTQTAIFRWRVLAGGPVTSAPVLVNEGNDLVFASQGGSVFNCSAGFKILNWEFATGGPIIGDIAVDEVSAFVAGTDRLLYHLDTVSGVPRWQVRFPEPLRRGPVVAGRTVYQYCSGEGITALDADSGEVLWKKPDAEHFCCRNIDHVYLTTGDHRLLMIDADSGRTAGLVRLPRNVVSVRNTRDETLYLVSADGRVLCGKPAGSPHLTPAQLATARRELYRRRAPRETAEPMREVQRRGAAEGVIDLDDPLRSSTNVSPRGGDE